MQTAPDVRAEQLQTVYFEPHHLEDVAWEGRTAPFTDFTPANLALFQTAKITFPGLWSASTKQSEITAAVAEISEQATGLAIIDSLRPHTVDLRLHASQQNARATCSKWHGFIAAARGLNNETDPKDTHLEVDERNLFYANLLRRGITRAIREVQNNRKSTHRTSSWH